MPERGCMQVSGDGLERGAVAGQEREDRRVQRGEGQGGSVHGLRRFSLSEQGYMQVSRKSGRKS